MFKASNVANMIRFTEGRGFVTRTMYNHPQIEFIGAFVFIISNGLPSLARDVDHKYDWDAIRMRTDFFEAHDSFPDGGLHAFPFNEVDLAHYL